MIFQKLLLLLLCSYSWTQDHEDCENIRPCCLSCVPESALRLVSRDGGITRSRGYLPFLGKRTDKANLKENHESFSYSPILIVSWVFSSEIKRTHFRSVNSVIVKCLHSPRRITWIHFFLRKEPWQSKDNQLSSLLELNLLFDGS